MSTAMTQTPDALAIERVLMEGDLKALTPPQRVALYMDTCASLGLNPRTRPFDYIQLNGKLVLYAKKDATDQLRNTRGISVTIKAREVQEDVYVVTACASLPNGRTDESVGAVPIAGLKGESRANAMMKAETKAKRRVTLSICGLGMLDESEADSVPSAVKYHVEAPATVPMPELPRLPVDQTIVPDEEPEPREPGSDDTDALLRIAKVEARPTRNPNVTKFVVILSDGREASTINGNLGDLATQLCQDGTPVDVRVKESKFGLDLLELHRLSGVATQPMLTSDDIVF